MVPSAEAVLDLVENFLLESEGAGWPRQHALEAVRERRLAAVATGGPSLRETRASRGSVCLMPELSRAGELAQRLLMTLESIDPKLRRVLELRAAGLTTERLGEHLRMSRQKAAVLLDRAVVAGQVFLLAR